AAEVPADSPRENAGNAKGEMVDPLRDIFCGKMFFKKPAQLPKAFFVRCRSPAKLATFFATCVLGKDIFKRGGMKKTIDNIVDYWWWAAQGSNL
ncbi:MAG: hypothetical protein NTV49_04575, partial [Kiritimatiellaeota bacterium]|nr:hypothetical protein [Kiritimatiellota bacterium]